MKATAMALALGVTLGQLANAQETDQWSYRIINDSELAGVEGVTIVLSDQVSDGCVPNPSIVTEAAELRLRAAGIGVDGPLGNELRISLLGYGFDGGSCAVYVSADLLVTRRLENWRAEGYYPTVVLRVASAGHLLTGPKAGTSARIRDAVAETTDSIVLQILRSRDSEAATAAQQSSE